MADVPLSNPIEKPLKCDVGEKPKTPSIVRSSKIIPPPRDEVSIKSLQASQSRLEDKFDLLERRQTAIDDFLGMYPKSVNAAAPKRRRFIDDVTDELFPD